MSARDDELTQRYREASEQEDARPGAHVRAAVRAHAQMLAPAPLPTAPAVPSPVAANQSHWKITALATVAVVGLTGLLLLQFQRGTPEEQEIAYGQRRAEAPARAQPSAAIPAPAPAAQAPSVAPAAPAAPPVPQGRARDEASPSARSAAQKPAASALAQAGPLAKTVPAPAMREAESPTAAGAAGAVSGFPASPPLTADRSSVSGSAPPVAPSTRSAPRGEMREHLAMQDAPAAGAAVPPPPGAAPAPAAETSRSAAPVQALPAPKAALRRQDSSAADNSLAAAAPRADSGGSASLPDDLQEAARTGHALQVEILIRQGAPIDARDNVGRTALMLAAMSGQATAVQKLLALGANPALVDREGMGAAQHARRLGYMRIAELIEATP